MTKEANKDEAERCKDIAMRAKDDGDIHKCIRLLEKSIRLYPNDETAGLLSSARNESRSSSAPGQCNSPTARRSGEGHRRRKDPVLESEPPNYTAEQARDVKRIVGMRSYYDILAVDRSATDDQVKKAYRKLALKFHPDKCKAPGAEEAFKKISKAFQCLSDSSKRRSYDASGNDTDDAPRHSHARRGMDPDFMTAQDIFEAFFGMHHGHQRHYHQPRQHTHIPPGSEAFRLLPVVILIGISLLSSLLQQTGQPAPRFSFSPTSDFNVRTTTAVFDVPYYAKADFPTTHPVGSSMRSQFETNVEAVHIHGVFNDCQYEDRVAQQRLQMARRKGIESEIDAAKNIPKKNCDRLEAMRNKHPSEFKKRIASWGDL